MRLMPSWQVVQASPIKIRESSAVHENTLFKEAERILETRWMANYFQPRWQGIQQPRTDFTRSYSKYYCIFWICQIVNADHMVLSEVLEIWEARM
jgi:hypothetical protein